MSLEPFAVKAKRSPGSSPAWATLQRELFDEMDRGWRSFSAKYTTPDGRLKFSGRLGEGADSRDGVDDLFESFFNWPQLYLLGGADDLLDAAKTQWRGVSDQLEEMGMLRGGFDRGYDWFHLGESLLLFYFLCLADPTDAELRTRASEFALLYSDPAAGNYDPEHRVIRAPHTGADGPRVGLADGEPYFPWSPTLAPYGLPLDDVEGVDSFEQALEDHAAGRAMGDAMWARMGRGDTAVNLAATSLVLNAYLMTGRRDFRNWTTNYAQAWLDRATDVFPDNVGLGGVVGEYHDGRWFGGHYGWAWPHGLHSVGTAALVAAQNANLLADDDRFLRLGRLPLDMAMKEARSMRPDQVEASLPGRAALRVGDIMDEPTILVPQRHANAGWHDYQVVQAALPTHMWFMSDAAEDLDRLDRLQTESSYDWAVVREFRDKEEAGHEEPWIAFLNGANADYPEQILTVALNLSRARSLVIERDSDEPKDDIDAWQRVNPVLTEALMQLTCGAPQVLYNGGLLQCRLRYSDRLRDRPGLPPGVAALVGSIQRGDTRVTLVNTDPEQARALRIQAGAFAQDRIVSVTLGAHRTVLDARYLDVDLEPGAQIELSLEIEPGAFEPSYSPPSSRPANDTEKDVS